MEEEEREREGEGERGGGASDQGAKGEDDAGLLVMILCGWTDDGGVGSFRVLHCVVIQTGKCTVMVAHGGPLTHLGLTCDGSGLQELR